MYDLSSCLLEAELERPGEKGDLTLSLLHNCGDFCFFNVIHECLIKFETVLHCCLVRHVASIYA